VERTEGGGVYSQYERSEKCKIDGPKKKLAVDVYQRAIAWEVLEVSGE